RYARRFADTFFARVARARISSPWEYARIESRFPADCGNESAGCAGPGGEPTPFGSILPVEHISDRSAAIARTKTGYSAAGCAFCEAIRATTRQTRAGHRARCVPEIARLRVARKCPRIAKR